MKIILIETYELSWQLLLITKLLIVNYLELFFEGGFAFKLLPGFAFESFIYVASFIGADVLFDILIPEVPDFVLFLGLISPFYLSDF